MTPIAENWKSPLAILVAVLALYLASLRVDARHDDPAPDAGPSLHLPQPTDGPATPNEIRDFQQLG